MRDGGVTSRVGAPQFSEVPPGFPEFMSNISRTEGVAPARAYIDELLPLVFDGVPVGCKAVADREALGVLLRK